MPQPVAKKPMVGWYDPTQLLITGMDVLISSLLGSRYDYRQMEALANPQPPYDYSQVESGDSVEELWFDYVADLGDGWNPTFAVATLLARDSLTVQDNILPRGRFLVMGGDQVYPVASRKAYEERLVGPYETALPHTEAPHPHLFAIPGNHDWYDGLVSFMRLFCQERWIGGWKTRQRRSYFALKLPHRWWLWAVDVQLESDIDLPQLDYFRKCSESLQRGDRLILCTAEPYWIYEKDTHRESNLCYLERKIIEPAGAQVYLTLAGDLHHYRRHEKEGDPNVQKIISGGGGAFLHPTHGPKADQVQVHRKTRDQTFQSEPYVLKKAYPEPSTTFRLAIRNLLFPLVNPWFGLVTAFAYLAVNWLRTPTWMDILSHPSTLLWILLILSGFYFFSVGSKTFRLLGGGLHGSAHLAAAFGISYGLSCLLGEVEHSVPGSLLKMGGILLGGYVAGPFIMGLYLLISLNLFRQHPNEAFSALRIEDYKNFLRLHIYGDGSITIYAVGINKVPRNDEAPVPHLIEQVRVQT